MMSLHAPLEPIPNGPRATLPARPPPAVRMLLFKTSPSAAMSCTRCHGTLAIHSTVKWCESCRPKHGERVKLSRQGRAAQTHASSVLAPVVGNTTEYTGKVENPHIANTDVTMADATGEGSLSLSRSCTGAMKRKADAMSSEGPAAGEQPGQDATPHRTLRKEFQTGQDLVRSLSEDLETFLVSRATSALLRPPYVNFHGSYTIVMDPDVRGERSVKQLVDELKQSAKLPCGNLVKRESEHSCGGHARTFWCACDPPAQHPTHKPFPGSGEQASTSIPPATSPAATASQAGAPLKPTQSTLVGWLANSQSKEKLDEVAPLPPPGCGGTITVFVVTDLSHPLASIGIKGQNITILIEHPGRDLKRALPW